jgi:diadenosine tetraphosphate (Ap4A) HIT family hydrolase
MAYDPSNIFAKIIRHEVPCKKVLENDVALAFYDIFPKAPIHVLVIPKGFYSDSIEFYSQASEAEIVGFYRFLGQVIEHLGIKEKGFRLLSNYGRDGGQEVPHFHVHILAGRSLGPMVAHSADSC